MLRRHYPLSKVKREAKRKFKKLTLYVAISEFKFDVTSNGLRELISVTLQLFLNILILEH